MSAQTPVNALVPRIYDIVVDPSALPAVLEEIIEALAADAASVAEVDVDSASLQGFVGTDLIKDFHLQPDAKKALEVEYPLYPLMAAAQSERSFESDDAWVERYRRSGNAPMDLDDLHLHLRDNYGLHHRAIAPLSWRQPRCDYIALHYGEGCAKRRGESMQLGSELLPHLAKALAIGRPFMALEMSYRTVLAFLDRLSFAVIITGLDRRIWLLNNAARTILERRDALRVDKSGRLAASNDSARNSLAHIYSQLEDLGNGDLLNMRLCLERAPRSAETRRIDAYVGDCSRVRHEDLGRGERGAGVLLTLSDPTAAKSVDLGAIEQLFGLTRSERAVCDLLTRGYSNGDIADMRNVSVDTVASQVKSLFNKTACKRRGELIDLAHRVSIPTID